MTPNIANTLSPCMDFSRVNSSSPVVLTIFPQFDFKENFNKMFSAKKFSN